MKNRVLLPFLAVTLMAGFITAGYVSASAPPVTIAIFPFKNLHNDTAHDGLVWGYADSLASYLNAKDGAGTVYQLVSMDDVRDQMLALNVDPKSPSYETDVWEVAKVLGAQKIVWGTYFVKYEKANIDAKIIDIQTVMPDKANAAERIRLPYADALQSVTAAGDKIHPGLK